ncbi:MAG: HAD family hydrolase [Fidelibacterota bacterium]
MDKLLLFDIDGTLIFSGRTSIEAYIRSIESVFGEAVLLEYGDYAGLTDPQIFINGLKKANLNRSHFEANKNLLYRYYIQFLKRNYPGADDRFIYPGVREMLELLSQRADIVLGLLTGNIEEGAKIKLKPYSILKYFSLGAFGSDSMDRNQLPRIAIKKAEDRFKRSFKPSELVIFGDTVHDVRCAKTIGAKSVVVHPTAERIEEIKKAKPDHFLQSFIQLDILKQILGIEGG